ncbi:hypothetical protein [Inquilinus limosus]|uniref:Uncharacterized protein n=1 Tax=Inquilinus limosus TaxID=171674 RepID=A0A211ZQ81_9PROT|nr:hypothetical protein [Inquilinus limosus]OWJ67425.1 hypothetical protein BWR60_09470 [Inquilinus limosus]
MAPLDGSAAPSLPGGDDAALLSLARIVWREGAALDAAKDIDEKTFNRTCDRLNRMRDQILATPARTAAGAAAKLRIGLWPDLLSSDGAAVIVNRELDPGERMMLRVLSDLDAMAAAQRGGAV